MYNGAGACGALQEVHEGQAWVHCTPGGVGRLDTLWAHLPSSGERRRAADDGDGFEGRQASTSAKMYLKPIPDAGDNGAAHIKGSPHVPPPASRLEPRLRHPEKDQ